MRLLEFVAQIVAIAYVIIQRLPQFIALLGQRVDGLLRVSSAGSRQLVQFHPQDVAFLPHGRKCAAVIVQLTYPHVIFDTRLGPEDILVSVLAGRRDDVIENHSRIMRSLGAVCPADYGVVLRLLILDATAGHLIVHSRFP